MAQVFLVRYGEIALKGQNRPFFLRQLTSNVEAALRPLGPRARDHFGRVVVEVDGDPAEALARLRRVFGVVGVIPARRVPAEVNAIRDAVLTAADEAMRRAPPPRTFKVDTRRADKQFPISSPDLNAELGQLVRQRHPSLVVQLDHPDLTIAVEIRQHAYVSTEALPGPGGLPVGTSGTALSLVSGGIDSPVATWLGARRGLRVVPVHFHTFPFTSERAQAKVIDICAVLASYTGPLRVWMVNFTEVAKAIQTSCPDPFRVLVMRRMMMRVADRLAEREDALAVITGESLGQVASQTLEAIHVIEAAAGLPVFRPLIGWDKSEIVATAREIGTYDISVQPYEDCCTIFVPARPRIKPTLREVEAAEARLDIPALVEGALERSETVAAGSSAFPAPSQATR